MGKSKIDKKLPEINQDRTLYRCSECKEPLATKKGNSFFVMKKSGGRYTDVAIEIQNPEGSPVRLACGKCKRTSTIFVTLRHKSYIQKKKRGVEN